MTMPTSDLDPLQREVAAFLAAHLSPPVARLDTHAAFVFLAGDRAYKMKRAVRYSFLDFSTLDRRRQALERELILNRRTAPELYLGLVPVVREPAGSLALAGEGEVVEWLLVMRRFPEEARLDRVAARGGLDVHLIDRLAQTIADFHRQAEVRSDAGGAAGMERVIAGNASDLLSLVPEVLPSERVKALIDATAAWFLRVRPLLEARRMAGRVRHCHGDLHLANIVLLDERPLLFDCIEFDDDLARIDVLYDLAFLIMDLLQRGLGEAAWRLLQTWNELVVDDAGLAALPLFLSVRAAIRAKVAGFSARLAETPAQISHQRAAAQAYLQLAEKLLQPAPPRLIAIGGPSGTGKSSLARRLAPTVGATPGAIVLRSDVTRKRLFGQPAAARLAELAYRPEISSRVFRILALRARRLLAAGCSVICDAVYGEAWQRADIEAVARAVGVPFAGFWLEAPAEVLEQRIRARQGDASDADVAVLHRQLAHIDTTAVSWARIDAARPLAAILAEIRGRLA